MSAMDSESEFEKKVILQVIVGPLRLFGGHWRLQNQNLVGVKDTASKKNFQKTYYMP